jgi:hypothetical protein
MNLRNMPGYIAYTSAYVSIYVSIRQHTSSYVSIYVSIRQLTKMPGYIALSTTPADHDIHPAINPRNLPKAASTHQTSANVC